MTIESTLPLRVYLVEDDEDLREEMVLHLARAGFEVQGLADAPAFYKAHALARCDVAVLDIGLEGENGLSIAAQLRASGPFGVVMASARGAVQDRIDALQQGADVYMVKPIHIEELVATIRMLGSRVRAVAPPLNPPAAAPGWLLKEGDWLLCDPAGRQLKLTTIERAFTAQLFQAEGAVVSRDQLIESIGGNPQEFDPKRLDVVASRLRRKAGQAGLSLPLHTVRGEGFQFVRPGRKEPDESF
ncbi:response regulator transcription factor [Variovorax sp. N23]|nr:response regulator transcription factor [Variovorax sp. N23]